MKLSDFDYNLSDFLIAEKPATKRDESRLLVLDKKTGAIKHEKFFNLLDYLRSDDILVVNQSKVFPARLIGQKKTGGRTEILLEHQVDGNDWVGIGRGLSVGNEVVFPNSDLAGTIIEKNQQSIKIRFNHTSSELFSILDNIGQIPLPPYIEKKRQKSHGSEPINDKVSYQTVYAKETGSCAAPTAGLHFTAGLLSKIQALGVKIVPLTLHVGLGTFMPIEADEIEDHVMHSEYFSIESKDLNKILDAKKIGSRIVSVGTTSTRVLEHLFAKSKVKSQKPKETTDRTAEISGWTNIFLYPGYKFKCVDVLITNFHLPKSTLLLLVSAFASKEIILSAYRTAIEEQYRFYSYGDAMLIV